MHTDAIAAYIVLLCTSTATWVTQYSNACMVQMGVLVDSLHISCDVLVRYTYLSFSYLHQ